MQDFKISYSSWPHLGGFKRFKPLTNDTCRDSPHGESRSTPSFALPHHLDRVHLMIFISHVSINISSRSHASCPIHLKKHYILIYAPLISTLSFFTCKDKEMCNLNNIFKSGFGRPCSFDGRIYGKSFCTCFLH